IGEEADGGAVDDQGGALWLHAAREDDDARPLTDAGVRILRHQAIGAGAFEAGHGNPTAGRQNGVVALRVVWRTHGVVARIARRGVVVLHHAVVDIGQALVAA